MEGWRRATVDRWISAARLGGATAGGCADPLLIGLSSAIGGFCVSQAYRVSEAAVIAPFEYVALVMSIIWSVSIFGSWPDSVAWIGTGLILASGIVVFWREAALNLRRTSNAYRQR